MYGEAQEAILDASYVLRVKGHVHVPHIDEFIPNLLAEAHGSRYSIHTDITKMSPT